MGRVAQNMTIDSGRGAPAATGKDVKTRAYRKNEGGVRVSNSYLSCVASLLS